MRQFGDETGAQINLDDVFRWVNEGQFQVVRRTGDTLASTSIPLVINPVTHKYNLPADFFKMQFLELDGRKLQFVSPAALASMFPELDATETSQGFPSFFTVQSVAANNAQVILAPKPGAAGTLEATYIRRPPLINSSEDDLSIPEEFHSTLITYCISKARQLDGDDEGFVAMSATFKSEVQEDAHDSHHKDQDTYPMIRPSPGDVWY